MNLKSNLAEKEAVLFENIPAAVWRPKLPAYFLRHAHFTLCNVNPMVIQKAEKKEGVTFYGEEEVVISV